MILRASIRDFAANLILTLILALSIGPSKVLAADREGLVLDAHEAMARSNGAPVQLWKRREGAPNQLWSMEPAGEDTFYIVNQYDPSMVLDAHEAMARSNGAPVQLWKRREGAPNQLWYIEKVDQGSVIRCAAESLPGQLWAGESLLAGQSRMSTDGRFRLHLQEDGNLIWFYGERVLWTSGSYGLRAPRLDLQPDGNLVVYETVDGQHKAVWASNTIAPGAILTLQEDGNCVLYHEGKAIWATNTLAPPRDPESLAMSIREILCERVTKNDYAAFGKPADEDRFRG